MKFVIGSILVVFAFTYLMSGRLAQSSPAMDYLHERFEEYEGFSVFRKSVLKTALDISKTEQLAPLLENINRLEQFERSISAEEIKTMSEALENALTNGHYEKLVSQSGAGKSTNVFVVTTSDNSVIENPVVIMTDSVKLQVIELNGKIAMKNLGSIRDFENIQSFIQNSKITD